MSHEPIDTDAIIVAEFEKAMAELRSARQAGASRRDMRRIKRKVRALRRQIFRRGIFRS